MPIPKPKFEKADDNTIRIIVERINDVPLAELINNRTKLLAQKRQLKKDTLAQEEAIDQTIKNIDEILTEAKKLGIVAKEKSKYVKKGLCKVCHKNPADRDGECVDCCH